MLQDAELFFQHLHLGHNRNVPVDVRIAFWTIFWPVVVRDRNVDDDGRFTADLDSGVGFNKHPLEAIRWTHVAPGFVRA
jgi:hypothetical protein